METLTPSGRTNAVSFGAVTSAYGLDCTQQPRKKGLKPDLEGAPGSAKSKRRTRREPKASALESAPISPKSNNCFYKVYRRQDPQHGEPGVEYGIVPDGRGAERDSNAEYGEGRRLPGREDAAAVFFDADDVDGGRQHDCLYQ